MQRVHVARTPQEAHLVRALLESAEIEAVVQNEHVFDVRGAVPMTSQTLPEVWVVDDAQYDYDHLGRRTGETKPPASPPPLSQ
jgi:hypothetical protein